LSRQLGRRPSRAEISRRLERSLGKIDQALQFSMREISLDHRVGKERDQPISEYLVDESLPDAEEDLIRREATSLISEAVAGLSNQERQVICYRYGIVGGRPRTLKEVGRIMRISRERVRQIENQAKQKLRKVFSVRRSIQHPPRPAEDDPGRRASHSTSH
jgi:RNA polymerase sigma factor (sigma-70 family)